jgi:hypothetical protein
VDSIKGMAKALLVKGLGLEGVAKISPCTIDASPDSPTPHQ